MIRGEPGAEVAAEVLFGAVISAVNLSETVAKLADVGMDAETVDAVLAPLHLTVVPFGAAEARAAGLMRPETRSAGLSLGDRACLAVARRRNAVAVTTDRAWARVVPQVSVRLVR